jgi:hypothetical protein
MAVDLLLDLKRPCQWIGKARDLLGECRREIMNLREANEALRARIADLEGQTGTVEKKPKTKTKKAA